MVENVIDKIKVYILWLISSTLFNSYIIGQGGLTCVNPGSEAVKYSIIL